MRKFLFAGMVVLIALFMGTCEDGIPENDLEYTDVVYSDDGSRVTLYLDGVGVPVTNAQRAMSTRLSKMAYDYLEVIFLNSTVIARAQWDLGQSAGISGVVRPENYGYGDGTKTDKIALLAVGRKEGRTLLGIGQIAAVDDSDIVANSYVSATGMPTTIVSTVNEDSKSVTFYVEAVKTGLIVKTPTTGADVTTVDSFLKTGEAGGAAWADSSHTKLGSSSYIPTYPLPDTAGATLDAQYKFFGAPKTYSKQLVGDKVVAQPRFPRYQENGRYRQIQATIDMKTTVEGELNSSDDSIVDLLFTVKGSGIFSFYIERPVVMLTSGKGTNTGELPPVNWKIRTGLGSELFSLDDGVSGGGCVLMTIGKIELEDWLEIQWEWLN